mmetsp:Transcript_3269/g.6622  ORF Transcript_3269/g.6622 Transcript_3269/m.6622 type:complete len:143 (-) Transcript_3269:2-430(-)
MAQPTPEQEALVEAVKTWFMQTEMEALFQAASDFADQHCEVFEPELGEHKLEYTVLHNQFREIFEGKLLDFLTSMGQTQEAFDAAFEACVSADANTQVMGELMWCALNYEFFCSLMCEKRAERRRALGDAPPALDAGPPDEN